MHECWPCEYVISASHFSDLRSGAVAQPPRELGRNCSSEFLGSVGIGNIKGAVVTLIKIDEDSNHHSFSSNFATFSWARRKALRFPKYRGLYLELGTGRKLGTSPLLTFGPCKYPSAEWACLGKCSKLGIREWPTVIFTPMIIHAFIMVRGGGPQRTLRKGRMASKMGSSRFSGVLTRYWQSTCGRKTMDFQ